MASRSIFRVFSKSVTPSRLSLTRFFSASASESTVVIENDVDAKGQDTGVRIIYLNNPKQLNALTVPMCADFISTIQKLKADSSMRAVVLTGRGRAFSAGGDLDFLEARSNDTPNNNQNRMREFYKSFLCIRELPVPVISCINGPAIGAGLCLANATDIRVAATDAKLGLTFASLGLHPGMAGTFFAPRILSSQIASYMLLTGDVIDGKRAQELGLVLEAVPVESVLEKSLEIARKIAKNPDITIRAITKTLRSQQEEGMDRALQREADAQSQSYASKEFKDNLMAMKAKAQSPKK